ncbi:HK97 family phage prohead protease [Tardiphaga sp. vice352]|uniref:HK97 family phage prohead protease n=1 Tax=unclassified Tardiphaga TaxID=2631404 RepID=UPI0011646E0B|nr:MULTISPECIES: HK97 family phage prohead protease [unclassified Tardiphaga]QDM14582.1 HK97 family phage prohead protease [Tardiphaga sp. vice278]QDM29970.1 HK97 family phage prohead protease [Tardiphaga sp. vice352]
MTDLIELKATLSVEDSGVITAMAWPFAKPDRVGDMIEKGAFANAVMPIPMLFGHDVNDPVGAWDTATERSDGLHLKGNLLVNALPRARELLALIKSGAVRGISIGFVTKKAKARSGGGRTISVLELLEASLVTIPMHPGARITSAKSAIQAITIAEAIHRATAALTAGTKR